MSLPNLSPLEAMIAVMVMRRGSLFLLGFFCPSAMAFQEIRRFARRSYDDVGRSRWIFFGKLRFRDVAVDLVKKWRVVGFRRLSIQNLVCSHCSLPVATHHSFFGPKPH
jgi:hypothetical protein